MLVASATLILGSCTDVTPTRDSDTHPALPTTVPSALPSTTDAAHTPTPAPPNPEAASLAVVKDYFVRYSRGLAAHDGTLLREISTSACTSCESAADAIESLRSEGARTEGGQVTVRDASLRGTSGTDRFVWRVEYIQDASSVIGADGATVREAASTTGTMFVEALRVDGAWFVNGISDKVVEK
ncbi:hypothetical protein IGS67_07175 [Flavimobilis sp. GY10621]|uniref:Mce-associated membrane protein n=1 Tax=Flavimobilis rhizosphaerae TaxID=2775421 RepID=A0ABR9DQ82_9MICO|nr:hypothetical protein [Flavimobilis rhizosphaerae]MBD9699271.1 hypothetical protein [Flavimobilis rhizosphaerae]